MSGREIDIPKESIEKYPLLTVAACMAHRKKLAEALFTNAEIIKAALVGNDFIVTSGKHLNRRVKVSEVCCYGHHSPHPLFRVTCQIYRLGGGAFLAQTIDVDLKDLRPWDGVK